MKGFRLILLSCAIVVLAPSRVYAFVPMTLPITSRQSAVQDCAGCLNDTPLLWISNHQEDPSNVLLHYVPSIVAALGSSLIMLTIVALLFLWEESVEWARETVPKSLMPVVESILAEIGGLGFIGLILGTVLGNARVKEGLESVSIAFFGEKDILVENFEYLHSAFFQVGVGFFIAVGAMTAVGTRKLNEVETVEGLELDPETSACKVTPKMLCKYIPAKESNQNDVFGNAVSGGNALWDELLMGKQERAGRVLLMRTLFSDQPHTFRIEHLIQFSFAHNLRKIVNVSPMAWLYIIPALSLANAVDLSHDVINSSSPNSADSVGYFFSTPSVFGPSFITVVISFTWSLWNCWKLTQIKYMMMPRLAKDDNTKETEILPPLFESKASREAFDSSPIWIRPMENVWAKPAVTPLDELFGAAGASGMDLYQNSIKYQAWLCVTHIVFFGTQIVPRDLSAWWTHAAVGNPEFLMEELFSYSLFIFVSLLQLVLISPRAFWNYCLIYASPFWNKGDQTQSCNIL
jgi:hypothetical protein